MAVNLSPVGGAAAQFFDNNGSPLAGGLLYTYAAGTSTPLATYTTQQATVLNSNPIVLDSAGRVPNEIWLTSTYAYKFVLQNASGVQVWSYDNLVGINSNFTAYSLQEQTFTATQGQTVFTLTGISYVPGTNNLSVFVNGSKQIVSTNYLETSSTVVTFLTGLNVGDVVDFITAISTSTTATTANNISYTQGGTGSTTTNVQAKLQQTVSVKDFGAVGDGTTNDSTAIQAAINYMSSIGGGTVHLPAARYYVGTGSPAISIPSFIRLLGDGNATGGLAITNGTELIYGGSGTAVYAQGMSISCTDFMINCTTPSGTSMIGLMHDGGWFGDYARLSIFGIPTANGYVVKVTSGPVFYGCYFTCFDQVTGQSGSWLLSGRTSTDGITTLTLKDCYAKNASFAYAQGVIINGSYTSNVGACLYFTNNCFFSLFGVDIEGAAPSGICVNDNTCIVKEFGTIWNGFSGTQRVLNNGGDMSYVSYGGFSSQQALTTNTPTLFSKVGSQAVSTALSDQYISDYILPTNLVGGSATASRYWKRFINGTNIIDHQWADHAYLTKAITTTATSAVTVMTIPIPTAQGLRISVFAYGQQIGNTTFANSRNCNVMNASGTLTITADTQVTAGDPGAISFVASGASLLIQWTPTTVNSSIANFDIEIRGPWTSYS
jgi:hypothetical protein